MKPSMRQLSLQEGVFGVWSTPLKKWRVLNLWGYTGGTTSNPIYENYGSGGHIEVVEVIYNPNQITYDELLKIYWKQVDPTDPGGQFTDRGHGYTTAIFYFNETQREKAELSKKNLEKRKVYRNKVITPILPAGIFYKAVAIISY